MFWDIFPHGGVRASEFRMSVTFRGVRANEYRLLVASGGVRTNEYQTNLYSSRVIRHAVFASKISPCHATAMLKTVRLMENIEMTADPVW